MSYLDTPRLHFAGQFQAAPSTVNNLRGNYLGPSAPEPLWNPNGTGSWRLVGCAVKALHGNDGPDMSADPARDALILDAGDQVSAKLVDLDPDQQGACQIWGLTVRIVGRRNLPLVSGRFHPAPMMDLWYRCPVQRRMPNLGAYFQSTLEDLEWSGLDASPFLRQLHERSPDRLSIKFNVDGYRPGASDSGFTYGRLVGTLGPYLSGEPRQFVAGRLLRGRLDNPPAVRNNFVFAPAMVDADQRQLAVDVGNSLPTSSPGGPPPAAVGTGYALAVREADRWHKLAAFDPTAPDFYETTAGVVVATLDEEQLRKVEAGHLGLLNGDAVWLEEARSRMHVRADELVFRMSPGDEADVELIARRAGHPPDPPVTLGLTARPFVGDGSPTGLSLPESSVVTHDDGRAHFKLRAGDPERARAALGLDGQVFGVHWTLPAELAPTPANPDELVSVLVWDVVPEVEQPTWYGQVERIFKLYHRLYPVMARVVDLSDYDRVLENLELIALSFDLPVDDPNHMPVTRDLSPATHAMLRRWFEAPLRGRRPPAVAPSALPEGAPRPTLAELDARIRTKIGLDESDA